jgi:hypothetical protein
VIYFLPAFQLGCIAILHYCCGGWLRPPRLLEPVSKQGVLAASLLFFFGVGFLFFYFVDIEKIPAFAVFEGLGAVRTARLDNMSWGGDGLFKRIWILLVRYGIALVALLAFANALAVKKTREKRIAGTLAIFMAGVTLIEGQKAQLVFFLVQIFIAICLHVNMTKNVRTGWSIRSIFTSVIALGIVLEAVTLLYIVFGSSSYQPGVNFFDLQSEALGAVIRRITITQSEPLVTVFQVFPDELPYLSGQTLPFAGWTDDGARFDLSRFTYIYSRGEDSGVASTLFVSEFYANYGLTGALLSILIFCILFVVLDFLFRVRISSAEHVAIYSFLSGYFIRLAITQLIMGIALPVAAVGIYIFVRFMLTSAFKSSGEIVAQVKEF